MGRQYNINPGDIFGRLTVVGKVDDAIDPNSKKHMSRYLCRCSCPNRKTVIVKGKNLVNGHTTSCGCILKENASVLKSGKEPIHPVYDPIKVEPGVIYAYYSMIYDANHGIDQAYNKQVSVCGDWMSNINTFYDSMQSTYNPGCKVQRINKEYGFRQDNCFWGSRNPDPKEKLNDKFISYNNSYMSVSEWNMALGYDPNTIRDRLLNGYSDKEAIIGKNSDIKPMNAIYFVNEYGRPLNKNMIEESNKY